MARAWVFAATIGFSQLGNAALALPGVVEKHFSQSTLADREIAKTGLSFYQYDLTSEQRVEDIKLDEKAVHQAKVWGLTDEEEKRYLALMQNRSAVFYEGLHLTPIDILGLNARNEAERAHFARLGAAIEAQKVAQNLAWNSAFYKAYNEIFKQDTVVSSDFDPTPFSPVAHKPVALLTGDELFLFIRPNDASQTIVLTLSEAIIQNPGTRLHLMILWADNETIQTMARRFTLSFELVKAGRITLNHGELQYEGLKLADKQTPLLLLSRNAAASVVDLGRI